MRIAFILSAMLALLVSSGCETSHKDAPAKSPATTTPSTSSSPSSEAAGPVSEMTSEIPLTSSEEDVILNQIEQNWNLGSKLAGSPEVAGMVVELRLHLLPDGTIARVDVLNNQSGDPIVRQLTEGAIRAVMISSPLKLPPGKTYDDLIVRFHMDQLLQ